MSTALRAARVAALAVVLGAPGVEASRLPFRLYQTGDGLPQSQVLALHQARDGEIWVGTWCGAAYYDGAQFRYLTQRSGLPSNYVRGIVEDKAGDLWLAVGNGVARVAADDRARPAEVVDPLIPRPRPSAVRDLLVDSRGVLWALSQSDGVAYRDGSRFVAIEVPEIFTDGLQLLAEQPAGTLLVGTNRGLVAIERGAARPWRAGPGPWAEPIRFVYAAAPDQVVFATAAGVFQAAGAGLTELKTIENHAIPL
ncbi:MAG TPA: two-component regulator propeller domain-containing protein, partial [Candidatus Dormibacteraeota bacterium]|nr:two-component regulator propeller domain-containing protein [Candidatus Dormibacteraeota bacterium]